MWEYKILLLKFGMYQELVDALNNEGNENWELVQLKEENKSNSKSSATILLRRRKQPACSIEKESNKIIL